MERYTVPPPPGSLVWERDDNPLGDPGTRRRLRGGTLIGCGRRELTIISGCPVRTVGRKSVVEVQTITLGLKELDPTATVAARDRAVERCAVARRILAALSARRGTPNDVDHTWLDWVHRLFAIDPHWAGYEPGAYPEGAVAMAEISDMPPAYEPVPSTTGDTVSFDAEAGQRYRVSRAGAEVEVPAPELVQ